MVIGYLQLKLKGICEKVAYTWTKNIAWCFR